MGPYRGCVLRVIHQLCLRCSRLQSYQLSASNFISSATKHVDLATHSQHHIHRRQYSSLHIEPSTWSRFSRKHPNHHAIRCASSDSQSSEPPPGKFPFWQRFLFVSGIGSLLYYIFREATHEKDIESERTRYKELGKAQLGGDWTLTDHHGKKRSSKDFHGQWVLLYFGFTHCPDICPEELEKLALVVRHFESDQSMPNIQPLFITLDPERDSPKVIKEYCAEYSPQLVGFTGTEEEIRAVCKKFRVYFGKGERDENNDYIVDHTIIIYLINPKGEFVNYFGRSLTAENVCKSVSEHIHRYNELEQKDKMKDAKNQK